MAKIAIVHPGLPGTIVSLGWQLSDCDNSNGPHPTLKPYRDKVSALGILIQFVRLIPIEGSEVVH